MTTADPTCRIRATAGAVGITLEAFAREARYD